MYKRKTSENLEILKQITAFFLQNRTSLHLIYMEYALFDKKQT